MTLTTSKTAPEVVAWVFVVAGVTGFSITFPLWLLNLISDRTMLGITLALSWAALWYSGFNAVQITKSREENGNSKKRRR